MNNPKWGAKRQCQECGARFYDLKRTVVVCPKCHTRFKLEAQPKAKRAIATPAKAEATAPVEKPDRTEKSPEDVALKEFNVEIPDDISLDADDDDDKDENAFEDASELGEDEDDMAEAIEGSRKSNDG